MSAEPSAAGETPAFSAFAALAIVLVGVAAFSALVVLFAYAPDLRSADNGDAHALSRSAVGYAGMVEALKLKKIPVVVSRSRLPNGRRQGLLVVTPPLTASAKDIAALNFEGPTLIILPKWLAAPDLLHRGWAGKVAPIDPAWAPKGALISELGFARESRTGRIVLHAVADPFPAGMVFNEGVVDPLQTISAKGWLAVLVDDRGATLLAKDPAKNVFVLSDPDLIDTAGLRNFDTFASALAIIDGLRTGDGPVIFDVTLDGLGKTRSVLRLLFDPPFLAVTLCLAMAMALAGFQGVCRFGPVQRAGRAIAIGKAALIDNTTALIRIAGREHRMGERYAALTARLAARSVGAPRELSPEALTNFLDTLSARRGAADTLSALTLLARTAPDRNRLLMAAQRLFRWRLEIAREPK
jgi:hypothetical protein